MVYFFHHFHNFCIGVLLFELLYPHYHVPKVYDKYTYHSSNTFALFAFQTYLQTFHNISLIFLLPTFHQNRRLQKNISHIPQGDITVISQNNSLWKIFLNLTNLSFLLCSKITSLKIIIFRLFLNFSIQCFQIQIHLSYIFRLEFSNLEFKCN